MTIRAGALSRGRALAQTLLEQAGQQERGEVIDREGPLQTVGAHVPIAPVAAGIVDQHVKAGGCREHFRRKRPHLARGGEGGGRSARRRPRSRGGGDVRENPAGAPRPGHREHRLHRCGSALLIASDDADASPETGERHRRRQADPARCTGHERGLTGHRQV